MDELNYFEKKYSFEIKIVSNNNYIIPEYKIDLLNKSKKLINSIEKAKSLLEEKKIKKIPSKDKKSKNKSVVKTKDKIKKTKAKKKIRTLWVRRKKN